MAYLDFIGFHSTIGKQEHRSANVGTYVTRGGTLGSWANSFVGPEPRRAGSVMCVYAKVCVGMNCLEGLFRALADRW